MVVAAAMKHCHEEAIAVLIVVMVAYDVTGEGVR